MDSRAVNGDSQPHSAHLPTVSADSSSTIGFAFWEMNIQCISRPSEFIGLTYSNLRTI
jgi:hypothetical protein